LASLLIEKVAAVSVVAIEDIPFGAILGNAVGLRLKKLCEVQKNTSLLPDAKPGQCLPCVLNFLKNKY